MYLLLESKEDVTTSIALSFSFVWAVFVTVAAFFGAVCSPFLVSEVACWELH